MNSYRKTCLKTCLLTIAVLALCVPAVAQQSADLVSLDQTGSAAAPQKTTAAQTSPGSYAIASSDADLTDKKWHYYGTLYIWFPGIHGTVGIRGFDTSIHVTAGEIFSDFRGGLLGVFIPTYGRFSLPVDFMWMRLKDDKAIAFNPAYSAQATLNFAIVSPKVSYLLVNQPKVKIYGTAGPRIWHLGSEIETDPTINGRSLSEGQTWTDFVLGGRFSLPLSSKASVDVYGDGGEGGATLDYQVGGLVSFQVKPKISLQGGWRYLTVHYGNNGNILNTSIQGIVLGATYKLK